MPFPKKYPWPASRLTKSEMFALVRARKKQGKPITVLIKEAVQQVYGEE